MPDLDPRLWYGAYAVAVFGVWSLILRRDWHRYRFDRRDNLPELVTDFALWLSAVAAFVSLIVLIVGQDIPGARGLTLALFLGGFLGAGIVKLTLSARVKA